MDRAQSTAQTKPGTVGVKVSILSPYAILKDKIIINEEFMNKLKNNLEKEEKPVVKTKKSKKKTKEKK